MTRTTDYFLDDIRRFLSKWDVARLEKLGATVTRFAVTATEDQLGKWFKPELRAQLARAGVLTVSGGAPDWVPANAKIYIDLVNDRAWTEADGEVAIDTLLGSDPNTENGWGASGYNAADLTADGLVYSGAGGPAFIGSARVMVLDAATVRFATKTPTDIVGRARLVLMSLDGNDAVAGDVIGGTRKGTAYSFNGPLDNQTDEVVNNGVNAVNVMALTVTPTRLDIAVNGSAAVAGALDEIDRPSGNPLIAVVLDFEAGQGQALQYITIYDALPSTAGLSALSQTGVTNTAPHDLGTVWYTNDNIVVSDSATACHLPAGDYPFSILLVDAPLVRFTFTDDEGNPMASLAITAKSNPAVTFRPAIEGPPIDFVDGNSGGLWLYDADGVTLSAGDITFTIRATDPGGLYVEQEFTITVTAAAPEWVPDGALYFADFIGLHYWNGAECAVTDLFEEDGAFGNFNPATDIGVSGLLSGSPCFKLEISSALIEAGFTAVCAFTGISGTDAFGIEVFDTPSYNTEWRAYVHSTGHSLPSLIGVDAPAVTVAERQPDGASKAAFVFTPTLVKLCQAGGTVYATDPSEHGTPATSIGVANATLQSGLTSIAIYAGNLSDEQLQALTA